MQLLEGVNADNPNAPKLPIDQCGKCGLVFTDPSAVPTSPEELYSDGYYGEKKSGSLANRLFIALFQRERQALSFSGRRPRRVLDVGCGDGTYLHGLPAGVERFGYETSAAGKKLLQQRGVNLFQIDSSPRADEELFDLITMWQSLEHIDHPDQVLQQLSKLLAPGGVLFLSVPNFGSIQARLFRGRWFHLDPTRHLFHYTVPTLRTIVERNGFTASSWTSISLEYGIFGWWQSLFNLLPMDFNMGYKILKGRKHYEKSPGTALALATYAVLAIPVGVISTLMWAFETLVGRGGVINMKAVKNG